MIITIGPLIMMKFVVATAKPFGTPVTVSMNPIMIDGTGMCGGCRLTLHEDGKRVLRVVCTQYPTMSTLNWLETLSLVFTAFSCPYWEDAAETSFLMPNTSDAPSKLLAVPGDAPETPLNLLIRNIGDTAITTLTISAAGKISFQGLTLAPGAAIRIHHDAGVFAAEMVSDDSTVSILPYRTPESADDLLLRPGVLNEIRVEASAAAFVSGRCKGRYC